MLCAGLIAALIFQSPVRAEETDLAAADRIAIIKILLEEKFDRAPREIVFFSSRNLPAEVRDKFPKIRNLKAQFLAPEEAAGREICLYEFGPFTVVKNSVLVSFGNCREGLAYTFKKYGDKWKSVLVAVKKDEAL